MFSGLSCLRLRVVNGLASLHLVREVQVRPRSLSRPLPGSLQSPVILQTFVTFMIVLHLFAIPISTLFRVGF